MSGASCAASRSSPSFVIVACQVDCLQIRGWQSYLDLFGSDCHIANLKMATDERPAELVIRMVNLWGQNLGCRFELVLPGPVWNGNHG
jgi:hypothetical protein